MLSANRRVAAATRKWISEFVVRERLCPFAAASDINVVVNTFGKRWTGSTWDIDPSRQEHIRHMALGVSEAQAEINKLLARRGKTSVGGTPNLFLVWPVGFADFDLYSAFVSTIAAHCGLASGSGGPEDATAPATAFPFHPAMGDRHAPLRHSLRSSIPEANLLADYRFVSPFPMLQ